jgi:hypothetical protein
VVLVFSSFAIEPCNLCISESCLASVSHQLQPLLVLLTRWRNVIYKRAYYTKNYDWVYICIDMLYFIENLIVILFIGSGLHKHHKPGRSDHKSWLSTVHETGTLPMDIQTCYTMCTCRCLLRRNKLVPLWWRVILLVCWFILLPNLNWPSALWDMEFIRSWKYKKKLILEPLIPLVILCI